MQMIEAKTNEVKETPRDGTAKVPSYETLE